MSTASTVSDYVMPPIPPSRILASIVAAAAGLVLALFKFGRKGYEAPPHDDWNE